MIEIKTVRVPKGNITLLENFMVGYGIEKGERFEATNCLTIIVNDNNTITMELDTDKMDKEIETMKLEFIDEYFDEYRETEEYDSIKKSMDLRLNRRFHDALRKLDKDVYLNIILKRQYLDKLSGACYEPKQYKDYLRKKAEVKDFASTEYGVEYDENGKLVGADYIDINADDAIDEFRSEKSSFDYSVTCLEEIAQVSGTTNDKYDYIEKHRQLSNALADKTIKHVYDSKLNKYAKTAEDKVIYYGNEQPIYVADVIEVLPDNKVDALREQSEYQKPQNETEDLYRFCRAFCEDEGNFKEDIDAFIEMVLNNLRSTKYFDKKELRNKNLY